MGKMSVELTERDEAILEALIPTVYRSKIEAIRDGLRALARENNLQIPAQ